jgi:hypothetical protein
MVTSVSRDNCDNLFITFFNETSNEYARYKYKNVSYFFFNKLLRSKYKTKCFNTYIRNRYECEKI